MLTALVGLCACALQAPNLLSNPDFIQGIVGWGPLYTRTAGAGTVSVDDGPDGAHAIHIDHSGSQDWAFYQSATIPAETDDVFEFSADLRASGLTTAGISVVTMNAAGEAIDWTYGATETSGTHDWKHFRRRVVIPGGCAAIRFRLVGYGPGAVWMTHPYLARLGKVEDFVRTDVKPVRLSGAQVDVEVEADGSIRALDRRNRHVWRTLPGDPALRVKDLVRSSSSKAILTLLDIDEGQSYTVTVTTSAVQPQLDFELDGSGPIPEGLAYPGPLATKAGDDVIVPMNEGIQFPAADQTAPTLDLVTYGGHGISMPWFGVVDSAGAGAMGIYLTPDDALFRVERGSDKLLRPRAVWQASRHELRYPRRFRLVLCDHGGYVALAKHYRAYAKAKGLLVTLREKQAKCPWIDRLVGAVNVWNWDMPAVEFCSEMKALGMKRVLWSRGGSPEELKALNDLGFLTSRYDIYQDVFDPKIALPWMNTAGWPDDIVLLDNGDWMKGWAHPDKQKDGTIHWIQGGVINSRAGLARAKQLIPAELRDHPYHCRFIDTTTASPLREDYSPAHPLSRSDDKRFKMALLEYCSKDMGLVVGSETGFDASVPYLDYFEGMMSLGPYRLPNAGTDMLGYYKPTPEFMKYQVGPFYRLPLWELVYHDCTVAQWYWGDATNKAPEVWDKRDLINILYGTAPLLLFDRAEWQREKARMVRTYDDVCRWDRLVGYDELVSHEYLTSDHTVQRTRFSSGRSVIVNFGDEPWTGHGVTVPASSYRISAEGSRVRGLD